VIRKSQLGRLNWGYAAFICFCCGWLTACSTTNHIAKCDQALADSDAAFQKKDFARAMQYLKVAAAEAEFSDATVHKHQVLREQIAVALAQNDPVQAENFARQLSKFEAGQEHIENSSTWRTQWNEDVVRADMLLGDTLTAQHKKTEALAIYKAADDRARELNVPIELETQISERYVQTRKELGTTQASPDREALAEALENYTDLRDKMYDLRSHHEWAKVPEVADQVVKTGTECNQIAGAVAAYNVEALAEYVIGHKDKAHECAARAIKLAHEHNDDKAANENVTDSSLYLAITDKFGAQTGIDAPSVYKLISAEDNLLTYLDPARADREFDRLMELRFYTIRPQSRDRRFVSWSDWVLQCLKFKRLNKGCAWADRLYARKQLDTEDMADCDEAVVDVAADNPQISKGEHFSRAHKAIALREQLRKKNPNDAFNNAHLAALYQRAR